MRPKRNGKQTRNSDFFGYVRRATGHQANVRNRGTHGSLTTRRSSEPVRW